MYPPGVRALLAFLSAAPQGGATPDGLADAFFRAAGADFAAARGERGGDGCFNLSADLRGAAAARAVARLSAGNPGVVGAVFEPLAGGRVRARVSVRPAARSPARVGELAEAGHSPAARAFFEAIGMRPVGSALAPAGEGGVMLSGEFADDADALRFVEWCLDRGAFERLTYYAREDDVGSSVTVALRRPPAGIPAPGGP